MPFKSAACFSIFMAGRFFAMLKTWHSTHPKPLLEGERHPLMTQVTSNPPQTNPYRIVLAGVDQLEPLSQLLNAHRVAMGLPDNQPAVAHFLFERLINHESVIFMALNEQNDAISASLGQGFVQIYPTFSAHSLMPLWILGEVYVAPNARRQGLATALITQALDLVRQRGDEGLSLDIPLENRAGRQLLEGMGFVINPAITHYDYRFPAQKL
jgi:GNAT superfamily N-acetyltransferase